MFQFFRDFIVVIVLMSVVFGCGKAPSGKEEAAAKTLTFWHIMNYSGPKEVLEGAVKRFEAAHPGVKVIVQTFENDAYKVKLANEMASGNSPDVFFTWGAGGQTSEYIRQGKVLCLNEYAKSNDWEGRFIDSALSICRNGGDLYSVPLDLSAVTLWCNKKLFDENGLAYPKTFEELVAVSTAFRAKKITPLALGNMKKWPGAFYFCYLANRCGGTQLFLDAAAGKDGAAFDDVAFVTAGKMLRGEGDPYRNVEDSVGQLAQLFTNIPAKNLMRDSRAVVNWFAGGYAKRPSSGAVMKYHDSRLPRALCSMRLAISSPGCTCMLRFS